MMAICAHPPAQMLQRGAYEARKCCVAVGVTVDEAVT